jgi:hypothetical protein
VRHWLSGAINQDKTFNSDRSTAEQQLKGQATQEAAGGQDVRLRSVHCDAGIQNLLVYPAPSISFTDSSIGRGQADAHVILNYHQRTDFTNTGNICSINLLAR